MKFVIKFACFLLAAPFASANAQCPVDQLALKVHQHYYAYDYSDLNLASDTSTAVEIIGNSGPYEITVQSTNEVAAEEIVNFSVNGSTVNLTGIGPGTVVLQIRDQLQTQDQDRLHLRIHVDSDTQFSPPRQHFFRGGVSLDNGNTFRNRVRNRQQLRLTGVLCPYADQIGQVVDVMAVIAVADPSGNTNWYNVRAQNQFEYWVDNKASNLVPFEGDITLVPNYPVTLFEGSINNRARIKVYVGFKNDMELVYDEVPETVIIENP